MTSDKLGWTLYASIITLVTTSVGSGADERQDDAGNAESPGEGACQILHARVFLIEVFTIRNPFGCVGFQQKAGADALMGIS